MFSIDADSTLDQSVDAEKLFINPDVQRLLTELTGMDLEGKVDINAIVLSGAPTTLFSTLK